MYLRLTFGQGKRPPVREPEVFAEDGAVRHWVEQRPEGGVAAPVVVQLVVRRVLRPVFNNVSLHPGVKFAPRGELWSLGGMFTHFINTYIEVKTLPYCLEKWGANRWTRE
jgi:hypothetical protein